MSLEHDHQSLYYILSSTLKPSIVLTPVLVELGEETCKAGGSTRLLYQNRPDVRNHVHWQATLQTPKIQVVDGHIFGICSF